MLSLDANILAISISCIAGIVALLLLAVRRLNNREPLAERYRELISKYRGEIRLDSRFLGIFISVKSDEYLEHCIDRCIREIGSMEKCFNLLSRRGESLSAWSQRPDVPQRLKDLYQVVKTEFESKYEQLESERKKEALAQIDSDIEWADSTMERHKDVVDRFYEIAERKVTVLDDYGDERWTDLPRLAITCVKKIAAKEKAPINWVEFDANCQTTKPGAEPMHLLPERYSWLHSLLLASFKTYHDQQKTKPHQELDVDALSGVEFEVYLSKRMRSAGFDVVGTPTTGDQGADLVAKKDGRKFIIQAKRYQGPVGNKAVQEVISALSFYGGDEGWVVTNSTFTPSAVALAQKANIKLVDGFALRDCVWMAAETKTQKEQ